MRKFLNSLCQGTIIFKNRIENQFLSFYFKWRSYCNLNVRNGFGTLEIVIIIAVLLTIALIFRKTLINYANNLISAVFDESIVNDMGDYQLGN